MTLKLCLLACTFPLELVCDHLRLTVSWDKAMNFFDSREAKKQEKISKFTPIDIKVILMFDNINMYRGKHKHLRLFKYIGPTMWNFTGQAALIPSVEGLEDILQDKNASLRPQKSVLQLDPNDIFIQMTKERLMYLDKLLMHFCWNLLMMH